MATWPAKPMALSAEAQCQEGDRAWARLPIPFLGREHSSLSELQLGELYAVLALFLSVCACAYYAQACKLCPVQQRAVSLHLGLEVSIGSKELFNNKSCHPLSSYYILGTILHTFHYFLILVSQQPYEAGTLLTFAKKENGAHIG